MEEKVVPEKEFEFSAKEDNTAENEWICPVCKESNSQHQISCKKCFAEKSVEDVRRCRNEVLEYIKQEGGKFTVTADPQYAIICIGDIHGNLEGLKQLFINLEEEITYAQGKDAFERAVVVFLGDYVDRGPDSRGVIQFLIDLPKVYPQQKHVFLMGNHDHQFTALIEALPEPQGGFTKYSETDFASDDEVGPDFVKDMLHIHPKGRRYAAKMQRLCGKNGGHDVYMTAVSYGCTSGKREDLLPLVPQSHIDFLKGLPYFCMVDVLGYGKLLCLHGGFLTLVPSAPQLRLLVERDPDLLEIEQMYQMTRDFTIIMPPADLFAINDLVIVSGHHGIQALDKNLRRVVIDPGDLDGSCGAAVFLPTHAARPHTRRPGTASPASCEGSPVPFLCESPAASPGVQPQLSPQTSAAAAAELLPTQSAAFLLSLGSHAFAPSSEPQTDLAHDEFPLLSEHIQFFTDFHREYLEAKVEAAHHKHLTAKRMLSLFGPPPAATTTSHLSQMLENTFLVRSSYDEALIYSSLITLFHDLKVIKEQKALKKLRKKKEAEERKKKLAELN